MQATLVRAFVEAYKKRLLAAPPDGLFKWESQQNWQAAFDVEALDLAENFDRALENSETRRLWQTEQYFPKKMMIELARQDPETVRAMFKDLFDETKAPENRLSRFVFGLDLVLADWRDARPGNREMSHFHSDLRAPSLYLAFQFPDLYAPYELPVFQKTMQKLGSPDVPVEHDPARWFKVARTLRTLLSKEAAIEAALKKWLRPKRDFDGPSLLLADDFARFICKTTL